MLQRYLAALLFAAAGACAKFSGEEQAPQGHDDGGTDGGNVDVAPPPAAPPCAGRTAFRSAGADATAWAMSTTMKSARLGGDGVWYVAVKDNAGAHIETRAEQPPSMLARLPGIADKSSEDEQATLSGDKLFLAFQSTRATGNDAIWVAKRASEGAMLAQPTALAIPGLTGQVQDPYFVGSSLYVAASPATGERAIFRTEIAAGAVAGAAVQVTHFAGASDHPTVTADQLELFFENKPNAQTSGRMMYARRAKPTDGFGGATEVSTTGTNEHPTWISPDGCDLWVIDADDKLQKLTRRP